MLDHNFCPSSTRPTITVQLHLLTSIVSMDVSMEAFVDSGAVGNFISVSLVKECTWTTEPLPQILCVSAIDGTISALGPIHSCNTPIKMSVGLLHH